MGLTVKARGPYGKFYFDESQHKRIVLIAAGSGVTPMMAMVRYIDDRCIPAEVTLIYCVRTRPDVFFRNELSQMLTRLRQFRWVPTLVAAEFRMDGMEGAFAARDSGARNPEAAGSGLLFMRASERS